MRSWWKGINWRTFVACLALATMVWMLNAFGEQRAVTFTFLLAPSGEQGRWADFPNPQVSASIELTVQDWIDFSWFGDHSELSLAVAHLPSGNQRIPSDPLRGEIERRFGASARVLALTPSYIELDLEPISSVALPVQARYDSTEFTDRALIGMPKCIPSSVMVTGRTSVISELEHLWTEPLVFSEFSGDSAELALVLPEGVSAQIGRVQLRWLSSKWVRHEIDLSVGLQDRIAGVDLDVNDFHILPVRVNLTYFYPEDLPEPMASEFEMVGVKPHGSGLWELELPLRPLWSRDPILQPGRIEVHRRISN